MAVLETALVVLVVVMILILLIVAVALMILLIYLKKAINKVNRILDQGEDIARGLGTVGKATAGGVIGLILRLLAEKIRRSKWRQH